MAQVANDQRVREDAGTLLGKLTTTGASPCSSGLQAGLPVG